MAKRIYYVREITPGVKEDSVNCKQSSIHTPGHGESSEGEFKADESLDTKHRNPRFLPLPAMIDSEFTSLSPPDLN